VIDAGDPANYPTTDFSGASRFAGTAPDAGAYESGGSVSPPPPPSKPGDVNGDGSVSVIDLSILLSHFGQSGQSRSTGDLNGDGMVSVIDLSILLSNFGT
jgi:hypothetical protein